MIIKPKCNSNYSVIPNELIKCEHLSDKAFRLACYLLSLPASWEVNTAHLAKVSGGSTRSIQRALKELIDLGFLQKIQHIDEKSGKFLRKATYVFINNEEEKESSQEIEKELKEQIDLSIKKELSLPLKDEWIAEKIEEIKALDKEDLKEIEQEQSSNSNGFESKEQKQEPKNADFKDGDKNTTSGFMSHILNKEFLQSKNSFLSAFLKKNSFVKDCYLMKTNDKSLLFLYSKKQNVKPNTFDFSGLSDFEILKLNEFFAYKQKSGKRLLALSKQKIINQCKDFKLKGQNIGLIIDRSIRNGWAGLFSLKTDLHTKKAKELSQKEILRLVLEQEPNFNFSQDYDLSKISINGKSVSYIEDKDEFKVV